MFYNINGDFDFFVLIWIKVFIVEVFGWCWWKFFIWCWFGVGEVMDLVGVVDVLCRWFFVRFGVDFFRVCWVFCCVIVVFVFNVFIFFYLVYIWKERGSLDFCGFFYFFFFGDEICFCGGIKRIFWEVWFLLEWDWRILVVDVEF